MWRRGVLGPRVHVCALRWRCKAYERKQKIDEILAVSSEMSFDRRSLKRPTNIPTYFIFLETKSTGLHFAADNKSIFVKIFMVSSVRRF